MKAALFFILILSVLVGAGVSCSDNQPPRPEEREDRRTLARAREITLGVFRELDAFKLEKQLEVGICGYPAVRMEATWLHGGQRRRGIIYVVDLPALFAVIHYTAPDENQMFEAGYPVFQNVLKKLKVVRYAGSLTVVKQTDEKVMRSPDLQLEIRYPANWVYSLDEVNRAIVLSGPRSEPTWLTTINFSVINKHKDQGR
jgi:hypothetical protein